MLVGCLTILDPAVAGPLAIPADVTFQDIDVDGPPLPARWDEYDARSMVLEVFQPGGDYLGIPPVVVEESPNPAATLTEGRHVRVTRDGWTLRPYDILESTGGDARGFAERLDNLYLGELLSLGVASGGLTYALVKENPSDGALAAAVGTTTAGFVSALILRLRRQRLATDIDATWDRAELRELVHHHNVALANELDLPAPERVPATDSRPGPSDPGGPSSRVRRFPQ